MKDTTKNNLMESMHIAWYFISWWYVLMHVKIITETKNNLIAKEWDKYIWGGGDWGSRCVRG